ncbi:DUF4153 domain-containing protein [Brevundimonas denitrificans]|uniref:DUF4153 domain-containing protein n=1 Tax=Brevundimonas denitrificans TaxID=1443434 RepID=A0ABQ6BL08_9CAUL|nr:DUF4153 domain-containing protein [Brevundimonas denitrificans]GLS02134.1 DUF4153 domain-containing protein [Brevundimonas denitrificans]
MTETTEATGRDSLGGATSPLLGPIRLGIGLLQGLGLYGLHRVSDGPATWGATHPLLFGPLLLVTAFLPIMLLAGVGRLRLVTLAIWTAVAGVTLALLGLHDIARQSAETLQGPPFLSPPVILFSAAALFISHHLVAAADLERRRVPAFSALFDTASKAVVQLALSVGFTGAFWILLHLGAALFKVIGLDFLEDLLRKAWFAIPITFLVFATAVHLTDVRDGLIRGVRTVGLMLLSWLLLVMTVLAAGFVAALPFTGLDGLWETGSATSLVLAAAAALIILINAAYQDGRPDNRPPAVLRVAVRVAAVLLTPLVVIAVWGLALRIGQYGLTPDRIIAGACALVGAAFAAGYGWAALSPFWRKGDWMRPLEPTTIGAAVLAVALILLLFSPVLDPARLSVMDQVARLERGAVTPDKFDYRFLRFESGKAGEAALERLTRSSDEEVARRARDAQSDRDRQNYGPPPSVPVEKPTITSWPSGSALPTTFLPQGARFDDERGQCRAESDCVATSSDLNGDGRAEILLGTPHSLEVFEAQANGTWLAVGYYDASNCKNGAKLIREGGLQIRRSPWPDITIGGLNLDFQSWTDTCPKAPSSTGPGTPIAVGPEQHGRITHF